MPDHVPRTYDVRELPVAGQPLPLDQCSFPAACAHTLTFSNGSHIYTGKDFGNYQRGAIVVRKVNLGGTQTDAFGFSSATLGDFSLAASETAGKRFSSLQPGTYGVAELPYAGYALAGAECSDGSDPAAIELSSGETVTCTFTNARPAIDLLKQVRRAGDQEWRKDATLQAGQTAEYLLTVTNAGAGALVGVEVADDRCDASPAYAGGDADGDAELDETEAWTYRCDHVVTAADGAQFVNTAEATATDKHDTPVRDTDTATVNVTPPGTPPADPPASRPQDRQEVLPEEIVSGTARMRGPGGCARTAFKTTVTGRRIQQVTFHLDGRQLTRIDAKRGQRSFALRINPRKLGFGVHRVRARVVFAAESRTATRTLRLSFQRCTRQAGTPQFTG